MNYRDKTDISATILELANGGASKSKIISTAFLNHSSSLQYFKMLLENKLLIYQSGCLRPLLRVSNFCNYTI